MGTCSFWEQILSGTDFGTNSFGELQFLGTATVKEDLFEASNFCKNNTYFFRNITWSRPFFKVVCHFIWRGVATGHSFILLYLLLLEDHLEPSIPSWRMIFYRSNFSYVFFQGLWQQLLIKNSYPAGVRSLEISLRDLNQVSIERDISETSQKHLKRDHFFETSLRRLKYISKKMSFLWRLQDVSETSQKRNLLYDVFKASQAYLEKDVFSVTSLRHLKNISRRYLWFFKNTPQDGFVWFR